MDDDPRIEEDDTIFKTDHSAKFHALIEYVFPYAPEWVCNPWLWQFITTPVFGSPFNWCHISMKDHWC